MITLPISASIEDFFLNFYARKISQPLAFPSHQNLAVMSSAKNLGSVVSVRLIKLCYKCFQLIYNHQQ